MSELRVQPLKDLLSQWREREIRRALEKIQPQDKAVPVVNVKNDVQTPEVHNHLPQAQVKVVNDVKSPSPQVKVVVDTDPIADALRELGGLLGSLIANLDKQNRLLEKMVNNMRPQDRGKRTLTIVHGDGSESTIRES